MISTLIAGLFQNINSKSLHNELTFNQDKNDDVFPVHLSRENLRELCTAIYKVRFHYGRASNKELVNWVLQKHIEIWKESNKLNDGEIATLYISRQEAELYKVAVKWYIYDNFEIELTEEPWNQFAVLSIKTDMLLGTANFNNGTVTRAL